MNRISFLLSLIAGLLVLNGKAQDNHANSRFDFIAGEKVIYYNNFESDIKGELPAGWNTTGSAEVVTINNSNWVKLLQNALFITDNTQSFSENFTVEFDLLLDFKYQDALFPAFSFGILSSGALKPNSNAVLQNIMQYSLLAVDLNTGIEQNSFTSLISYEKGNEFFNSGEKPFKSLENMLGQVIHVSIQVQQQRFRLWLNTTKLLDVPQALPAKQIMNQMFFRVFESSYSNEQVGIYVTNIKIANGVPDMRSKLMKEGRFTTTGILFDVNTARIKPESYGILQEIATVIKSNSALKILIVGHTDADGNEADNLKLSKERSEAVKQMLVQEFSVPADLLSSVGKGETEPVSDNKTKEGKAQNRRVEFIKQ